MHVHGTDVSALPSAHATKCPTGHILRSVRSIASRSDQTARNCFLTVPTIVPPINCSIGPCHPDMCDSNSGSRYVWQCLGALAHSHCVKDSLREKCPSWTRWILDLETRCRCISAMVVTVPARCDRNRSYRTSSHYSLPDTLIIGSPRQM